MLARSPISQVWKDEAEHFSRLVENGITLAIVDRSYGTWDGHIEQTVRPFKSRTTRLSLGGLRGFASREAAKIAVEDAIHSIRSEERVSAEAAVVGSQTIRSTHGRDPNDEHRLSKSQLL